MLTIGADRVSLFPKSFARLVSKGTDQDIPPQIQLLLALGGVNIHPHEHGQGANAP
jgi:hypothetical protein